MVAAAFSINILLVNIAWLYENISGRISSQNLIADGGVATDTRFAIKIMFNWAKNNSDFSRADYIFLFCKATLCTQYICTILIAFDV